MKKNFSTKSTLSHEPMNLETAFALLNNKPNKAVMFVYICNHPELFRDEFQGIKEGSYGQWTQIKDKIIEEDQGYAFYQAIQIRRTMTQDELNFIMNEVKAVLLDDGCVNPPIFFVAYN